MHMEYRIKLPDHDCTQSLSGINKYHSHDHFGSYLDECGVTINEHLEMSNFEFAVNVLAEMGSSMEIDGYHVTTKYVGPGEQDLADFPDIK